MRFINDSAIVIRRRNIGEADRIVTLFTKHNGKINVVAKGVRRVTSRRSALLEPFNLIDFHSVKSHQRHVLTEVQLISSFEKNKNNLEEYKRIFTACELVDALCGEEEVMGFIFDQVLEFASDMKVSILEFQTNLLVSLGYWNPSKQFVSEKESHRYIESIIERKLRSQTLDF